MYTNNVHMVSKTIQTQTTRKITLSVCAYLHSSIHIQHTAGAYAGGRSWSGCMMAGSESWGLAGAGGRSFDFSFSLVFVSVLVGGEGRTGYIENKSRGLTGTGRHS